MEKCYKKIIKDYGNKEKISYTFAQKPVISRVSCTIVDDPIDGLKKSIRRDTGEVVRIVSAEEMAKMAKKNVHTLKTKVVDYIDCNEFNMFGTLTFKPKYNNEQRCKLFTQWANNIGRIYPEFKYVCVKELHESGFFHFHLMIKGLPLENEFVYSGKVSCKALKKGCCDAELYPQLNVRKGKTDGLKIYNALSWEKYGWSSFTIIVDLVATQHYITKYITKDLVVDQKMKYKKKYYCSKGLKLPKIRRFLYPKQISNNLFKFAWCDMHHTNRRGLFLQKNYENLETNVICFTYDKTGEVEKRHSELSTGFYGKLTNSILEKRKNSFNVTHSKLNENLNRLTFYKDEYFDLVSFYEI